MKNKLNQYLKTLVANKGSDLHIKAGAIPRVRVHGVLRKLGNELWEPEAVKALVREITTADQYVELKEKKSLDMAYILDEKSRFRVNIFHQMNGLSIVMRLIPVEIPDFESLGLPNVIKTFADKPRGLVLVTGVTGSGKSTTLAAILNRINEKYSKHIITLEDPIEFVHKDKKCLINQRSIGQDSNSFRDALPAALREDPDIILVGEMRDTETIDLALHAANTGHLVFSTLHTLDAKETVNRVIGMFPEEEQNRVRLSLASVLEGVISQRLAPTRAGGRIAAVEVMVKTARIEELIAENRDFEIPDAIAEGREIYGSQTFDQHLYDLVVQGIITEEVAMEFSTSPSDLKLRLEGIGRGTVKESAAPAEAAPSVEDLDAYDFKEDEA
ncbi:type IV pilus twitching motility protein PilT [Nitratifractor salsuginis]|uniref:Twitching motility protein n=1 Tax=Nitratifractor salsuginis (strain DSM 16511 / JCM 12458 / E9I37-1) TaxID=749222 RepID=E6WZI0_NITSE|nr:type IV pilus twitching motility protein PilT [Nitratifractor salsuginis]ADV45560.1 twitching motility protein [Nitratifractor salsuginis DSM 16511]